MCASSAGPFTPLPDIVASNYYAKTNALHNAVTVRATNIHQSDLLILAHALTMCASSARPFTPLPDTATCNPDPDNPGAPLPKAAHGLALSYVSVPCAPAAQSPFTPFKIS